VKKGLFILFLYIIVGQANVLAQEELVFPETENWNVVTENSVLSFKIRTSDNEPATFYIEGTDGLQISFDTVGNFSWKPSYDLVDRIAMQKDFTVVFEAKLPENRSIRKSITFTVLHENRPPVVEELPVFYVKQSSRNVYQFPTEYVYDPDGDPIVFRSSLSQMPEGAALTSAGQFSWAPSRNQFNNLRTQPYILDFSVQDQPNKNETPGRLKIMQTQQDLPVEILIVPGDSSFIIKEDEPLNLKIYLSDPNGDDNVRSAGMIAGDTRIAASVLKENTPVQYEFTWTPGYAFTDDAKKFTEVDITFFALDKTNNRTQKKVRIKVLDAENIVEKDALQFIKYRNSLMGAALLINQLDENQKKLNQDYKKARKGKKNRSIVNATLGATTGISPIALEPDQAKVVSGIGGTTVLTMGTLEATEVIGRSKEAILEKIRVGIEIRNKIQSQGDEFARKYSLKSSRRSLEFEKDIDKLRTVMNDQRLVLLELDAYTRNRTKIENKEIKKIFIDFTEE
jgi:hypothetical protein